MSRYLALEAGVIVARHDDLVALVRLLGLQSTVGDGAWSLVDTQTGDRPDIGVCPCCDAGADELAAIEAVDENCVESHLECCNECRHCEVAS